MLLLLESFYQNDKVIFNVINHQLTNPFFDWLMPFLSWLGNNGAVWILIAVMLFLLDGPKGRRVAVLIFLTAVLCDLVTEQLIKHIVSRPRPFLTLSGVRLLVSGPKSFSFPSGHAAVSFAVGLVLARNYPKFALPSFLLAVGIAYSRVYVGVHYPFDVLAGVIIGGLVGYLAIINQRKLETFIDEARSRYFHRIAKK